MADYRRPDVYIEEKTSFPVSVLEVESAIPAFIGFTEKDPTPGEPIQINSMDDFQRSFGGAYPQAGITSFTFDTTTRKVSVLPKKIAPEFMLYYALKHYFNNGGAKCFVLSCGPYVPAGTPPGQAVQFSNAAFSGIVPTLLDRALEIEEVTLLVLPELVKLATITQPQAAVPGGAAAVPANADYANIEAAISSALNSIVTKQKLEKFFILDVVAPFPNKQDDINEFDDSPFAGLSVEKKGEFMAFYYPYLETTYRLEVNDTIIDALTDQVTVPGTNPAVQMTLAQLKAGTVPEQGLYKYLNQELRANTPLITLPPSSAMAGIYVQVDETRGVWKSPANVSVSAIKGPSKFVDDTFHEDLNINPLTGRSVCAIRTLPGRGTRVMGGRTLRGSSSDFRYISVRRFVSIAEKSIKNAMKAYLFEPNNPTTWGLVKGGISNYLTQKWQQGALLGAKAEDSFFVRIGLGTTMSQEDVLNGKMIVEIGLAVVRPAEFIILRIEQFLPEQLQ